MPRLKKSEASVTVGEPETLEPPEPLPVRDGGVERGEGAMDVLRHGAGVEISAPDELRRKVTDEARRLAAVYD